MKYTRNVIDYETGQTYRVSIGEHLTVTELANNLGVTRANLMKFLLDKCLFQREWDDQAEKPRNRLHPDAQAKGLGHRISPKMWKPGSDQRYPFDVLSPSAVEVVREELPTFLATLSPSQWTPAFLALQAYERTRTLHRMSKLEARARVNWLLDHYEDRIPVREIAKRLGQSVPLVYRYRSEWQEPQSSGRSGEVHQETREEWKRRGGGNGATLSQMAFEAMVSATMDEPQLQVAA